MDSKQSNIIIGYAIGEAFGLPVQYCNRQKLLNNPVTKMLACSKYNLLPGTYSSGTSTILAFMNAVIKTKRIDCSEIKSNLVDWLNHGKYTATGQTLDIGFITKHAILNDNRDFFKTVRTASDELECEDNDVLPRMIPLAIYLNTKSVREYDVYSITKNVCTITHIDEASKMACYILVKYINFLFNGNDKYTSYNMLRALDYTMYFKPQTIRKFDRILIHNVYNFSLKEIISDENIINALEAVFYVVLNSTNFKQTIIGAANLGGSSAVITGICGALAGIIYGSDGIPNDWYQLLQNKDYLLKMINEYDVALTKF